MGVRLELAGEAEAVEIDYRTETAELGYRGAGAGTSFALFRGEQLVSEAAAALGAGTVRLAAGRGPARAIVYLPEAMRPTLLALARGRRRARAGAAASRAGSATATRSPRAGRRPRRRGRGRRSSAAATGSTS